MQWLRPLTLGFTVLLGLTAAAPPLRAQFPTGRDFRVSADPGGLNQVDPRAAAAPDGRFAVTWVTPISAFTRGDVKVRFFDALGRPRGAEIVVAENKAHSQFLPAVAMAPNGSFVIVWLESPADSGEAEIFARAFGPGGRARGPAFQVAESTASKLGVDVAIGSDGVFVVTWSEEQGSPTVLFRRFAPGGQPLGPDTPLDEPSLECQEPRVAVNPRSGDFAITCIEVRRPNIIFHDVVLRRFHRDGTPDGPRFRPHGPLRAERTGPQLSLAADGRLGVVWKEHVDGSFALLRSRRFTADGTPLGPVTRLSGTDEPALEVPLIAALANGSFLTTWLDESDLLGRILGPAASSRSRQFPLRQRNTNFAFVPALGLAPTGRGVVAWTEGNGVESQVIARRLTPAP
jgi:hypothetical protein